MIIIGTKVSLLIKINGQTREALGRSRVSLRWLALHSHSGAHLPWLGPDLGNKFGSARGQEEAERLKEGRVCGLSEIEITGKGGDSLFRSHCFGSHCAKFSPLVFQLS